MIKYLGFAFASLLLAVLIFAFASPLWNRWVTYPRLDKQMEDYQKRQERELQRREQMQYEVKQEAAQASSAVEDLKRREELISRTLVFAEKTKADIIANARKEAENILHEAELKAKRAIQEAKQYLGAMEHQYVHLKEQKRQFLMQFKSELQTFMDRIGKDPLLTKDTEQLLDTEFRQIKEEIAPTATDSNPAGGRQD